MIPLTSITDSLSFHFVLLPLDNAHHHAARGVAAKTQPYKCRRRECSCPFWCSGMEIKTEPSGTHTAKLIESLKKHLFEATDSHRYIDVHVQLAQSVYASGICDCSNKTVSSHEVRASMVDLVETVSTSVQR